MERTKRGAATRASTDARLAEFIAARAIGLTLTEAARRAGCTGNDKALSVAGVRLQRQPGVLEAVEQRRTELQIVRNEALEAEDMPTAISIIRGVAEVERKAKETGNLAARLKALEMLGREFNLFTAKTEVRVDNPLEGVRAEVLNAALPALRALMGGGGALAFDGYADEADEAEEDQDQQPQVGELQPEVGGDEHVDPLA